MNEEEKQTIQRAGDLVLWLNDCKLLGELLEANYEVSKEEEELIDLMDGLLKIIKKLERK